MGSANTIFLRLEGPLQAWGDSSQYVIRRVKEAPTKSGVLGLICSAMGIQRKNAAQELIKLNTLKMGVRVDRPGTLWWDYHTAGAKIGLVTAAGKIKYTSTSKEIETLVSRRQYLCDASFLVALHGCSQVISEIAEALQFPVWPYYLGRKSCPPSRPVFEGTGEYSSALEALEASKFRPRLPHETPEPGFTPKVFMDWEPTENQPAISPQEEIWFDKPVSFDPPVHDARVVKVTSVTPEIGKPIINYHPLKHIPRVDYQNPEYQKTRQLRIEADNHLCVFCKDQGRDVHHVTYKRAGGNEKAEDLRYLCKLCHDAITMLEYDQNFGTERIDPSDNNWRDKIIGKRKEIIKFRSLSLQKRLIMEQEEVY